MANFGLVGKSLLHSFSKDYFAQKFKNQKLKHNYLNLELPELSQLRKVISEKNLSGFNVTIPYKQEVLAYLDILDGDAEAIGAVNCVKIEKGIWKGYNTDWMGFNESLIPLLNGGKPQALILGTGGASKAVAYGLKQLNLAFEWVSRNERKGRTYQSLEGQLKHFGLIVNTTPLGTYPHVDSKPNIPYHEIGEGHICFDLIYNPSVSAFLKHSKARGARIKNGLEMLEIQAEKSWEIWRSAIG